MTYSCRKLISNSFLNFDQKWFKKQQDVNEVLSLFIGQYSEAFHDTQSSLLNLFSFQIITYIKFEEEQYHKFDRSTTTIEHSLNLSISEIHNIKEALLAFFSSSKSDDINVDENCYSQGTITYKMKTTPDILFINLKRIFRLNEKEYKDCHKVNYFHQIDLFQLGILDNSLLSEANKYKYKYNLIGLVVHQGNANGGHYQYLSYQSENQCWYSFNDLHVKEIKKKNVTSFSGGNNITATQLVYKL